MLSTSFRANLLGVIGSTARLAGSEVAAGTGVLQLLLGRVIFHEKQRSREKTGVVRARNTITVEDRD